MSPLHTADCGSFCPRPSWPPLTIAVPILIQNFWGASFTIRKMLITTKSRMRTRFRRKLSTSSSLPYLFVYYPIHRQNRSWTLTKEGEGWRKPPPNIEFHSKKHKKNKIVNGKTTERDCVNDFSKLAWRFLKLMCTSLLPSSVVQTLVYLNLITTMGSKQRTRGSLTESPEGESVNWFPVPLLVNNNFRLIRNAIKLNR